MTIGEGDQWKGADKSKAVLAAVTGAVLFGFICIFIRFLHDDCGIPSFDVATIRLMVTTVTLALVFVLFFRADLHIRKKDIPFFAVFGVFKFLSDGTFIYGLGEISVTLSTLLGMTAPYFVMLLSFFLFKERIDSKKVLSVILASTGCVLVTGVLFESLEISIGGAVSSLLSGLFYATYFVGGKMGNERGYSPGTVLFYLMFFGFIGSAVFSFFTSDLGAAISRMADPQVLGASLFLGIALTLIPFYLFAYSTPKIGPEMVSMISILELVVAALVGVFVYGEAMDIPRIIGMMLVVLAIIVSNYGIAIYLRKIRAGVRAVSDSLR